MDFIISNPNHSYKNLHYTMKGLKRVQLGHFVLVFSINRKKKQVAFEDYNHHDKIYYWLNPKQLNITSTYCTYR